MSKIIEISYHYEKHRPFGWHKFYQELEEKMIFELRSNGINPKKVLFRGIKFSDFKRLIKTGYDLPLHHNFYAGAISDGHHSIRTALEYANLKISRPWVIRKSINEFIIACYNKDFFTKNEFVEKSGYNNYNWILKEGFNYKNALQIIFLFKPVL